MVRDTSAVANKASEHSPAQLNSSYLSKNMPSLDALDLLVSAILLLDINGRICYANLAAESLLQISRRNLLGQKPYQLFKNGEELVRSIQQAIAEQFGDKRQLLVLERPGHEPLNVSAVVAALWDSPYPLLLELHEIEQHLKLDRGDRILDQTEANRELVRNLAHEIRNPLGGIRGAAQLLESELTLPNLREYTQVIIAEADRLKNLVDQLLAPHRVPRIEAHLNIHEVCERVARLIEVQYPQGLSLTRDYDISVPELCADKEQLIQALLNIMQNAAQALQEKIAIGDAHITLRTRVARQVTIARKRYRLALELQVIDNGPGIPDEMRDRIFFPLVSGRQEGYGLGLSLSQTFVQQNGGVMECTSRPGYTEFRIRLPLSA